MIVNSRDVEKLGKIDPIFIAIVHQFGLPPDWTRPPGFLSLSRIILEQQVSLDSANAAYLQLKTYLGQISPERVLQLSPEEWKSCYVSRQKARYISLLAAEILEKGFKLSELTYLSDDEVRARLTQLKGIGPWTTNVYLLFCLQRKDVFPPGDIALIRTVQELKGVGREKVGEVAKLWSPFASLAAFLLWHYYLSKRGRTIEYHE
jgi:DNA-3-methyladenine glycosylase II